MTEACNEKDLFDKRLKLFEEIVRDYEGRENYQKDIAEKHDMPVEVVRQVLHCANFRHGRLKTHDNLRNGEKMKLMVHLKN